MNNDCIKQYYDVAHREYSSNVVVRVNVFEVMKKGKLVQEQVRTIVCIPTEKKAIGDSMAYFIVHKLNQDDYYERSN